MQRIRSAVLYILYFVLTVLSVGVPASTYAGVSYWIAPAPTGAAAGDWATFSGSASNWVGYAGSSVQAPLDNWKNLAVGQWSQANTFDISMIQGEQWITMARADAGGLGLTSQQISDRMSRFPANSSYVFAAYSPENAELHVEVQRIEKRPDGRIYVDVADFTPWHGEKWKAAGKYRTAAEISAGSPGYNPFENFKGSSVTDPVFHNVGWTGVQVILGHAMRHYNAMFGFVAVSRSRLDQHTSTSGSLFKKTVTVTVNGYVKPEWYVATPVQMQTDGGMTASICVAQTATASTSTTCDDAAHVAISGISISQWKGGNMPVDETQVYSWQQKKSSFTIIFFTLVLALLTFGLATVLLAASPALAGAATAAGLSAGGVSAIAGAAYAIGSTVFGSGGSLVQAQAGLFGSTGNGVINVNLASLSAQSQGLAQAVRNSMVLPAQGYGTTGMNKLYKGTCPESYSVAQCQAASLDPGQIWRSDGYSEVNMTSEMRALYASCKLQGLTGAALMQCAAPNATSWQ